MKRNEFNLRGLTSLVSAASFLVLAVSGVVAYVVPHGRIAYWTDWTFLGLTKTNWASIHVSVSVLFLIASGFHIYFNWGPLTRYVMSKAQKGVRLNRELAIAAALLVFFVFSSVYRLPPISNFLDLSESFKGSWVAREYEPPFGRAELLSLESFCRKVDISVDRAVQELEVRGFKVPDVNGTLEELAKRNNVSPVMLYMAIKHLESKPASAVTTTLTPQMVEERFAGSGIGRKTISEVTSSLNVDISKAMKRLKANAIDARDDEPIKQSAERNRLQPIEILKVILIEDYNPVK